MTYSITANTPEQMRDEIVKWLKMNASNHRIAARNARLVSRRSEETTMGVAYQNAADFLERCVIERKVAEQTIYSKADMEDRN